jgi:putative transposase
VKPAVRHEVVRHLQGAYAIGERRACDATGFHRSSQRLRADDFMCCCGGRVGR